jgi:hypothetical protein
MKTFFKKAIALFKRQRYTTFVVLKKIKEKVMDILRRNNNQTKQVPLKRPGIAGYTPMRVRRPRVPLHQRHDTIGITTLLVWLSGTFCAIAVSFNISTAGTLPKILAAPLALALAGTLVWKFSKK